MKKKIICFILVMCFIINFGSVFAVGVISNEEYNPDSLSETVIYDDKNGFKITYEYNSIKGMATVRGYENNTIIEENFIYDNDPHNVYINERPKEDYYFRKSSNTTKILPINEIVTKSKANTINEKELNSIYESRSSNYLGQLEIYLKNSSQKFRISVSESLGKTEYTTYTIRNYVGSLVTLATVIIGAFEIPGLMASYFASQFLAKVCYGLGIAVVGGAITTALSTTVNAQVSDIYLKLSGFSNKTIKSGLKAYIYDTKSSYRGNTFYDGITGKDWGSSSLARMVIGSVFGHNYVNDYDYSYR